MCYYETVQTLVNIRLVPIMVEENPDSVTLFFRNPANIQQLKVSQLLKLADLQTDIDELKDQELNDVDLAHRDVCVGRLRDNMVEIVEGAMVDGRTVDRPTVHADSRPVSPHHMTGKDGHHLG